MQHSYYPLLRFSIIVFLLSILPKPVLSVEHLQGIWKTEGYGYIFDISGTRVDVYEHSLISCLRSGLLAKQVNYAAQKLTFDVAIPGFIEATMHVTPNNTDNNLATFHRDDTITYLTAHRIVKLPETCIKKTKATATEVFQQTFAEHYPFFDPQRQLKVDANTSSETTLFENLVRMVRPLRDSHIAIVAPNIGKMYFGHEEAGNTSRAPLSIKTLLEKLGQGTLSNFAGQQLVFTRLNEKTAYLAVRSFSDYNQFQLHDAMKRIISPNNYSYSHLILDLRFNQGGSDKLALELAGYFTDEPYQAYSKQAFLGSQTNWTNAKSYTVKPNPTVSFKGNVTILTSNQTISAGETFVMAMMERKPKVKRIGQATRGSFSDMLPRILPNGWLFALPNERYLDNSNQSYDWQGIPPHQTVNANDLAKVLKQIM
jgi:hypothetical protein